MKRLGQVTKEIFSEFLNLSFTKNLASAPSKSPAASLMEVKGETRIKPPSNIAEHTCTAGPEPIDLPWSEPSTYHNYVLGLVAHGIDDIVDDSLDVGQDGLLAAWCRLV